MKTTTLAATAFAMSGVLLFNQDTALAKGPLGIEGQSPLILVKETPTEIDIKDFPWGLDEGRTENVRMSLDFEMPNPEGDEPISVAYVITIPWIEVEKDGDDKVSITMDEQILTMNMPIEGDDAIQIDIEMLYDNLLATFERDGDRMKFAGTADGMAAAINSPQLDEQGVEMTYKLVGEGLEVSGEGAAEQDWADIRAIDIAYDYTLQSMDLDMSMGGEGMGGQEFAMNASFGETQSGALIGGGKMSTDAVVNDFAINVTSPMPLDVKADKMEIGMAMPTEPSPKPQDIKYKVAFEGIELSDQIWAMADPMEAFPRDLKRLVIDMEMQAMMMVSIFDPAAMAEVESSGMPPLIPTSAKINSIAFDGLGLTIDATGEGALNGTQPEGNAYVSVKGLSEFVASAQKAGMFGEQEAMMVEGMAGQLGKEGDDGELIFDINTDGGMINVNGAPVAPIPGME